MRRVIVIAAAGMSLAGCSSFSLDAFRSAPPTVQVQLDSNPQGADARTSLGPSCKTPCSVAVAPTDPSFSVSYELPKFQPTTVQVQVARNPGDFSTPASTTIDPNPVVAELQPAGPPPKPIRRHVRPRKPRPPKAAAAPAPAPADQSFPAPPPAAAPQPVPPPPPSGH